MWAVGAGLPMDQCYFLTASQHTLPEKADPSTFEMRVFGQKCSMCEHSKDVHWLYF